MANMLIFKIFFTIVLIALGILFLVKTEPIVRMVGHNSLAEKYLGQGGSYTFWKILGTILIILGVLLIFGRCDSVLLNTFFSKT